MPGLGSACQPRPRQRHPPRPRASGAHPVSHGVGSGRRRDPRHRGHFNAHERCEPGVAGMEK